MLRGDYEFEIPEKVCSEMGITDSEDVGVYTVCTIQENVENMTFNLASPIVVNIKEREAVQLILDDTRYGTQEKI